MPVSPVLDSTGDVTSVLQDWAARETLHWARLGERRANIEARLRALTADHEGLYLFEFAGGTVRLASAIRPPNRPAAHHRRPPHYLALFEEALPLLPADFSALIGVSLTDGLHQDFPAPLFCFQRRADQPYLLLPDIDFITRGYHQAPELQDSLPFAQKAARAVFAGATSGGALTVEVARNCSLPRLRAARYFQGNAKVDFRLPKIGKHVPAPARAIVAAYPFCQTQPLTYQEQFQNKFIISMDGNGATCQRVAVTLASNSVLMKYASPHRLHYFHGLQPGRHYLPVDDDSEVEPLVDAELAEPGRFADVAVAGQAFARTFLIRPRIVAYTALLLRAYAGALAG